MKMHNSISEMLEYKATQGLNAANGSRFYLFIPGAGACQCFGNTALLAKRVLAKHNVPHKRDTLGVLTVEEGDMLDATSKLSLYGSVALITHKDALAGSTGYGPAYVQIALIPCTSISPPDIPPDKPVQPTFSLFGTKKPETPVTKPLFRSATNELKKQTARNLFA